MISTLMLLLEIHIKGKMNIEFHFLWHAYFHFIYYLCMLTCIYVLVQSKVKNYYFPPWQYQLFQGFKYNQRSLSNMLYSI